MHSKRISQTSDSKTSSEKKKKKLLRPKRGEDKESEAKKSANSKSGKSANGSEDAIYDSDESKLPWDYSSDSEHSDDEEHTLQQWSTRIVNHPVEEFSLRRGPRHNLPVGAHELDYLGLFLNEGFYETVAQETNRYAEYSQRVKNSPDPKWIPVTAPEIKAYIGILIYMGIIQAPTVEHYFWGILSRVLLSLTQ